LIGIDARLTEKIDGVMDLRGKLVP
jgi:hypothetical protein